MTNTVRQYALDFPHRTAYGREDFLISPCNEAAVKWIDLWPDWPAPALVLYGEAASGKTHLSYVWQERVEALRLPVQDLIGADFSRIFTKAKALIIEDVDRAIGDIDIEKALFHLYNIAKEDQGHILLTAHSVPSSWGFQLPDLRSRLLAAPSVSIHAPDDALLNAVLVKMFMDRQLEVSEEVLNYISTRIERSFSCVRQLVERADNIALSEKKGITIPVIKQALEQM
jgi:DnaA regulatory inactivator Hda